MLACTAMLVGCSDDDVLNNNELDKPQGEEMQAYLTFSIASAENSSRGVNSGTTSGDTHNNPEHSGHENVGTPAENKINDIMIVFYNETKDEGFCGNYTISSNEDGAFSSTTKASHNGVDTELDYDSTNKTYTLKNPYTLKSTGFYKVLVVVNPNATLKAKANASVTTTNAAKAVYEEIIKGETSVIADIIGEKNSPNFMMTNRAETTIEVTPANNSIENAAGKSASAIEVERVVSKITFRPTTTLASGDVPTGLTGDNLYKIVSNNYDYQMTLEPKWLSNGDDDPKTTDKDETTYKLLKLYQAKIGQTTVWVYTTKDPQTNKVTTVLYQGTGETHDGSTSEGPFNDTEIVELYEGNDTDFRYVGTKIEANPATTNYYIKLTDYTLVNLNNKVYYVRHTSGSTAPTDPALCYWGGIVSQTNYLIEPNTKTKSVTTWPASVNEAKSCFGETAIDVITTAIGTDAGYSGFTALPTKPEETDDVTGTVTPLNPSTSATPTDPDEATTVGNFMAYCFENNVNENNMNAKTTTGIIFKASIYDEEGQLVKPMFKYGDSFYPSLETLIYATGEGDSPFYAFTDKDYTAGIITDDDLLAANIIPYKDGTCYYFSAEIKHHDDGNAAKKQPMEYAIMRNNIYSLAVSDIKTFGFSSLNINDQIDNSIEETENLYMTLKARILPWIVRFNNVEF